MSKSDDIGFMELLYGWVPVLGYPLALINFLCKKKGRAKFFLIYSTIGIIPFVWMVLKG